MKDHDKVELAAKRVIETWLPEIEWLPFSNGRDGGPDGRINFPEKVISDPGSLLIAGLRYAEAKGKRVGLINGTRRWAFGNPGKNRWCWNIYVGFFLPVSFEDFDIETLIDSGHIISAIPPEDAQYLPEKTYSVPVPRCPPKHYPAQIFYDHRVRSSELRKKIYSYCGFTV